MCSREPAAFFFVASYYYFISLLCLFTLRFYTVCLESGYIGTFRNFKYCSRLSCWGSRRTRQERLLVKEP